MRRALLCGLAAGIVGLAVGSISAEARGNPKPPGCCKVCRKGIACGDSCIPAGAECHQPPGCACQG
jgi:hypothetical protein